MARPMVAEWPLSPSLVVMKGAVVALLVAAAAFAPTSARAEAPTRAVATITATLDRIQDAGASFVPLRVATVLRPIAPEATTVPKAAAAAATTDDPSRTLPPTDTELPAVDGRH